jgi:hypothetical protein
MIFVYDKKLASKYILFGFFLLLVIVATAPLLVMVFLLIVPQLILGWLAIATFVRAYYLLTKKIILSTEGVSFYTGSKREKTVPWNVIESYSVSGEKVVIKVSSKFIYITNELKDFYIFRRLVKQIMDQPEEKRGVELPPRARLEAIKDLNLIKVKFEPSSGGKLSVGAGKAAPEAEFLGGDISEFTAKSIVVRDEDSYISVGVEMEMFGDPEDR